MECCGLPVVRIWQKVSLTLSSGVSALTLQSVLAYRAKCLHLLCKVSVLTEQSACTYRAKCLYLPSAVFVLVIKGADVRCLGGCMWDMEGLCVIRISLCLLGRMWGWSDGGF